VSLPTDNFAVYTMADRHAYVSRRLPLVLAC